MNSFPKSAAIAALLMVISAECNAQQPAPTEVKPPSVKLAVPLAVTRGSTTRVTLRGLHLEAATEVRTTAAEAGITLTLASKAASPPPNGLDAQRVGDTELQLDVVIPAELSAATIGLVVVTADGESMPVDLEVLSADSQIVEQEPNDGYRQSQLIEPGKIVIGSIQDPRNVDVFRIDAVAGQRLTAIVTAARTNSPLDPLLLVCDDTGRILYNADDVDGSRDAKLNWTATHDGNYLLCLLDANDGGSPLHAYKLQVTVE